MGQELTLEVNHELLDLGGLEVNVVTSSSALCSHLVEAFTQKESGVFSACIKRWNILIQL